MIYHNAKFYKMKILYGILRYRFLNSANLSTEQKQLVRATVNKMEYSIMKDQLKKVFTTINRDKNNSSENDSKIKIEKNVFLVKGRHLDGVFNT